MRALRLVSGLLAATLLLAACVHATDSAFASDVEEYRERISSARSELEEYLVTGGEASPGEIVPGLLRALPVTERVTVGDVVVEADHSAFRSLLTRLDVARDPQVRVDTAGEMVAHLSAIERSLPGDGEAVPSDPEALAELLERSQLQARSPLTELIGDLIERLGVALERWQAALASSEAPRRVMAVGLAVLVALLGGLLAWVFVRLAIRLRTVTAARERSVPAPVGTAPVVAAEESLPLDVLAYAESLASAGRHAEAVRALFGGAARSLADAGRLTRTRTRTNAELLAEVRGHTPAVAHPLAALSSAFELAVYGHLDPGLAGYAAARGHYDAVIGSLATGTGTGSTGAGGGERA